MNDVRGAVFQLVSSMDSRPIARSADGTYMGNVVADMQIMVAKAVQDGVLTDNPELQVGINNIGDSLINWAMSSTAVYDPEYRCNGDSMYHGKFNVGWTTLSICACLIPHFSRLDCSTLH